MGPWLKRVTRDAPDQGGLPVISRRLDRSGALECEQSTYAVMRANEESAAAALAAQRAPQRALADQARLEQEALVGMDYGAD